MNWKESKERMGEGPVPGRDPLGLGQLDEVAPRRDGWPGIERVLRQQWRLRRSVGLRRAAGFAAIAALIALTLFLVIDTGNAPSGSARSGDLQSDLAESGEKSGSPGGAAKDSPALAAMIGLSRQLERRLRRMKRQSGAMPLNAVLYQVELEDLLAQIDEQLSHDPDSLALWQQRVNLLLDLGDLYQEKLRREYRQIASL